LLEAKNDILIRCSKRTKSIMLLKKITFIIFHL